MNSFITPADYDASVHREIIDTIIRDDATVLKIIEDRAIADVTGYLSERYDCEALFSARGDDRLQLVVMMTVDVAIYHIFCMHNPMKLSQMRKDRYERAIEWLKHVASGKINIAGAPKLQEQQRSFDFSIHSLKKRTNHF
ncbi:MAG: phage protein Gp36 family protein [Marinifilaceae bacterium]